MKQLLTIFTLVLVFGCEPKVNNKIIADKYVEGFSRTKYTIANNRKATKDKLLLPLIDSIIVETKNYRIKSNLRQIIIGELEKFPMPKFESDQERFKNLKLNAIKFEQEQNTFLEDLSFIDLFLAEKYWQYWTCDMGIHRTETLLSLDTVILKTNTNYELPIRIEYNGLPSSVSIISNSIQGSKPNMIKFKTQIKFDEYQVINYECEGINEATGELITYKDKLVIELIEND